METAEEKALTPSLVDGSRQLAIEIRAQRELALSQPRDEGRVFKKALAGLEFAPEFAEDAYYAIPFNKKDEDSGETVKEFVEGLSVVASRDIVRLWGNCATAWRIAGEDDKAFEVEGVFSDFETNTFFRATVRVRKSYIPRGTSIPVPLREDRLNLAIQAGGSKAERNAALKGIPGWFKDRYFQAAKAIAGRKGKAEGKSVEDRKAALFAAFVKLGATKEQVEVYIAEKFPGDSGSDDFFGTMRGILNGIKDKHTTVAEVFTAKKVEEKGAVKLGNIPGSGL